MFFYFLGEGYSEERNDLPDTSNQANATPSKINLPFLKKSQDNVSISVFV